jgi:hypothetical protein
LGTSVRTDATLLIRCKPSCTAVDPHNKGCERRNDLMRYLCLCLCLCLYLCCHIV